jgi:hypothetical protein
MKAPTNIKATKQILTKGCSFMVLLVVSLVPTPRHPIAFRNSARSQWGRAHDIYPFDVGIQDRFAIIFRIVLQRLCAAQLREVCETWSCVGALGTQSFPVYIKKPSALSVDIRRFLAISGVRPQTIEFMPMTMARRSSRKPSLCRTLMGSVVLGVNNSGETIHFQFSEGPFHPRGSGFGRQSLPPKRLCETESEVDPTVVGHEKQSRVSNRPLGNALQDDPLAEAVLGLMVLVVGDPRSRLFDATVWSTRGEPHDQGIAKPIKRDPHIIRCERTQ